VKAARAATRCGALGKDAGDVPRRARALGVIRPVPRELVREEASQCYGVVVLLEACSELRHELFGECLAGRGANRRHMDEEVVDARRWRLQKGMCVFR
jgi:hypothetical protein